VALVHNQTIPTDNLDLPSTNLSTVQKGVFFSGSKIYNRLPLNIKLLSKDIKVFKSSLRSFLIENVFLQH
jgi:hypothetical protein